MLIVRPRCEENCFLLGGDLGRLERLLRGLVSDMHGDRMASYTRGCLLGEKQFQIGESW